MSDQPYVVLHGGFHKTATSHIQGLLNRNRNHLRKHGVNYVNHRTTRKMLTVPVMLNAYTRIGINFKTRINDDEMDQIATRFRAETCADAASRTIISDENMVGHCGHCIKTGSLYRFRHELLATFARNLQLPVREVHLAIRSYDTFFSAAYVEFLRSVKSQNFVTSAEMKHRVLEKMPSWERVIAVFLETFPQARIVVWRHEDFRDIERRVIANLVGPDIVLDKLRAPKSARKRPTASDKAVRVLLERIERSGAEDAIDGWRDIQANHPRTSGSPAYNPWTDAEEKHLQQVYARDVLQIDTTPRVELIRA